MVLGNNCANIASRVDLIRSNLFGFSRFFCRMPRIPLSFFQYISFKFQESAAIHSHNLSTEQEEEAAAEERP
jgi:hypothetical protein